MTRLSSHAARLASIAVRKKARLPGIGGRRRGLSATALAEHHADLATVQFAHRIVLVMSKAEDEFAELFLRTCGVPL